MKPMTHRHTRELDIFYKEHHEKCTNCGKLFNEGSTVHVGYTCDRKHAVLCDECSCMLQETVVRYYHQADPFEAPCPNDKLWRYMDLAKFISIISTKTLYFASLQSFDDPFEGAKGPISRKKTGTNFILIFSAMQLRLFRVKIAVKSLTKKLKIMHNGYCKKWMHGENRSRNLYMSIAGMIMSMSQKQCGNSIQ